ncbi:hypothetical protein AVEN_212947-2, partial [Araneus ventricosus]
FEDEPTVEETQAVLLKDKVPSHYVIYLELDVLIHMLPTPHARDRFLSRL